MDIPSKKAEVSCPRCESDDTWCLEALSAMTSKDYLQCRRCSHIWWVVRTQAEPPCDFPPGENHAA